jgi:hypothetical protein
MRRDERGQPPPRGRRAAVAGGARHRIACGRALIAIGQLAATHRRRICGGQDPEACHLCGRSVSQGADRLKLNSALYHVSCWDRDQAKKKPSLNCAKCGEPIAAGAPRYNLKVHQYHAHCYDRVRHL